MPAQPEPADVLPTGNISPKIAAKTAIQHDLRVPMRDGVELSLDLIRPSAPGAYPVVLVRTPYDKTLSRSPFLSSLAERGYIIAIQDCRGRFNSDGDFFPYRDETRDGYDTVQWIAEQAWCDGNVGMAGGSYVGQTQWFAAAERPAALKALAPIVSPPDSWSNEPVLNGCMLLPMGEWLIKMGRRSWQLPPETPWFDVEHDYFRALPLAALPEQAGTRSDWWDEMLRHPTYDDFWRACSYQHRWANMSVAALNVTGWWDMNFPGAPGNFAGMREHATMAPHDGQKLIIGPWPHQVNKRRALNGLDFGERAVINLDHYMIRFYDRYLKGIQNGIEHDPPVHVFVLNANEWWTADDWPLPGAEEQRWYLHSRGRANSLKGDGGLSPEQPGDEPADVYRYDPADPLGAHWNLQDGPVDDRLPAIRDDMLCYTSEPMREPLDVVGPVSCVLYAASSARDTDWFVRLVDVHPDGSARFLCHGAMRARYRESLSTPRLLEPGRVERYDISIDACGVRFLPGHRIRLEVGSSWFPRYDRNTNSGADNPWQDAELIVARQEVYHDAGRASYVSLPVVRA
jgi:putative CocE/NonD family hydrolase